MALHGDAGEGGGEGEDLVLVLDRHRSRLEEVAGVVELQSGRRGDRPRGGQGLAELRRQGAGGCGAVQRLAPEIAEDAGKRAFGSGQEDGERRERSAV